ncbi:hypothetical protein [Microbulbifer sp. JMSA003]|uniref:hypothetical protein n=1 Tax=Microbulbifer sp. JMSA003 TaxID=3243369 RepID=UPI0040397759
MTVFLAAPISRTKKMACAVSVKCKMSNCKLPDGWEPEIIKEEIVASGDWFYQDEVKYFAKLIKQTCNYTSFELNEMYDKAIGHVGFEVSDEGVVYFCRFKKGDSINYSDHFSAYFLAKDHINTYRYKYDITWS